jgi:hypothetical protein
MTVRVKQAAMADAAAYGDLPTVLARPLGVADGQVLQAAAL